MKQDALALRGKLLPLVREARDIAVKHDGISAGIANSPIVNMIDPALASLMIPDEAAKTADIILSRLEIDGPEAVSLANRVITFAMPVVGQIT